MKYKRRKPYCHRNSSVSSDSGMKKRSALHRRAVAAGVVIITLFSLTRLGLLEKNLVSRYLDMSHPDRIEDIAGKGGKEFLNKLGHLTSEFCFGYLRSEKHGGKAYAVNNTENSGTENVEDEPEALTDTQVCSDSETAYQDTDTQEQAKFEPVMPCAGNITSPFGQRIHPLTGAVTNHNGVDIGCGVGTAVCAVYEGTVEKSEYNQYSGNYIVIRHSEGFTSSYAHLSESLVTVGQSVATGAQIGKSGSTGMVTGPHLHFEIRQNGNAVNPFEYIPGDSYQN